MYYSGLTTRLYIKNVWLFDDVSLSIMQNPYVTHPFKHRTLRISLFTNLFSISHGPCCVLWGWFIPVIYGNTIVYDWLFTTLISTH